MNNELISLNPLLYIYDFFEIITASANLIMNFLVSYAEEDLLEILNLPYDTRNFELLFGSGLIIALVAIVIKLFNPFS